MGDMDMRSIVEGAWNEAEANETAAAPDGNGVGVAEPADAGVLAEQPTAAPGGPGDTQAPAGRDVAAAAQRARDQAGRFARAKEAQAPQEKAPPVAGATSTAGKTNPPLAGGDPSPTPPPAPTADAVRAPQSLTPQERELFAKAPVEVQRALQRIDQTARQALQESAPARRFQQEMTQTLQPYEQLIRDSGMDPIRATQNLFQTVHVMRTGDLNTVAGTLASMARTFGGRFEQGQFIQALANHLDKPQQAQPQQAPPPDPRQLAAQVRQEIEQDWVKRQATTEVQKFYDDQKNDLLHGEHSAKVWANMMARVQAASMQNEELSLEAAYESAIWGLPETRAIVQKRAAAEAAKATAASTQQARNAASSVRSTPSTGASSARTPKTHRDIVEAAWDSLDGR